MSADAYVFRAGSADDDVQMLDGGETEAHTVARTGRSRSTRTEAKDDDEHDDGRTQITAAATTMTGAARRSIDPSSVPFHIICTVMEQILKGNWKERQRVLHGLWKKIARPDVSLYPVMRLLLPQLDSERPTYGLRESSLADAYIQALGLSKALEHAIRLKNYKTPYRGGKDPSAAAGVSGDFALVLADVLKRYDDVPEGRSTITVREVNDMLDQLSQDKEKGSEVRVRVFRKCVLEMSPNENLWFTRIITKDLKMGMKHESMLKMFHPDAQDIYNACSSLKTVCEQVAKPDTGREKTPFAPIAYFAACKPMLASVPTWNSVISRMNGCPFYVEDKFDGERILIHKRGKEVKLFTRNSIDYTNRYNYGATFTPIVLKALGDTDCIIDGELLTWDKATEQYVKFGSNRTIALGGANVLGETRQLCYVAFDILMLGTDVLIEKPLEDRRPLLHSIVNQTPHEFEVVKCRTDITTSAALLDALMESVSKGLEGLIVKNATTPYVLADRSDKWVKIKPDYIDGLRDNMDLVLLGGYYGEGTRRAGNVSHFLLGVFEKQLTPPEIQRVMSDRRLPPPPMYTFCKVGSGYSKVRLEELRKELASKFKPYDPRNQPAHFMGWKHEKSDIPDVWIDPRDSVIFEIKAYELTSCRPNKFSAGYTCRFPRVVQIRKDKDWSDGMTRDDMLKLAEPAIRQSASALREAGAASAADGLRDDRSMLGGLLDEDAFMKQEAAFQNHISTKEEQLDDLAGPAGAEEEERPRSPDLEDWRKEIPEFGLDANHTAAAASSAAAAAGPASPAAAPAAWDAEAGRELDQDGGRWGAADDHDAHMGESSAAGAADDGTIGPDGKKRRKKGTKRKPKEQGGKLQIKKGTVLSLFQPTDVSNIGALASTIFEDKSFCVMSTDRQPDKAYLEKLIAMNGGSFTQNPTAKTFCIIAKWKDTIKVAVQREAKTKDIVHYSWLEDSVRFGRLLPLSKKYVISGTPATQAALEREVDAYGDSFTQVTDENGLISAFAECAGQFVHPYDGGQEKPAAQKAKTTRALLEAELSVSRASPAEYRSQFRHLPASVQSSLRDPIRTFAGADVWVYGAKDSIAVKLGLSVMQLLGARVSETLHSGVSHILHIPSDDGASSIGSLEAILPSFKLRLVDKDAAAPGAGAAADGSSTVLIDLQWIEEKRQQVQVAAAERDHAPMQE